MPHGLPTFRRIIELSHLNLENLYHILARNFLRLYTPPSHSPVIQISILSTRHRLDKLTITNGTEFKFLAS